MIPGSLFLLAAGLARAQNAAQDRAAEQAAQQALDDMLERQKTQMEAQALAGKTALSASDYFLSERLYWALTVAVESLPEANKLGLGRQAEAAILDLSAARRELLGPWSTSAPTSVAQSLDAARISAGELADGADKASAKPLEDRARWIARSAQEAGRQVPRLAQDWRGTQAEASCYRLERTVEVKDRGAPDSAFRVRGSSSGVYSPGMLAAIKDVRVAWSADGRMEELRLSRLSMNGTALRAHVDLERSPVPFDPAKVALVWSQDDAVYPLSKPVVYDRSLDGRDFRVSLVEGRAGPDACHVTRAEAEALFDLPAD